MRIYELAKQIGERFSIKLKASDLAKEMREMPELADVHDEIKSHASTVDDEYAAKVMKIYEQRLGAPRQQVDEETRRRQETERLERKRAEEARRREEIQLRRQQMNRQRQAGPQRPLPNLEAGRPHPGPVAPPPPPLHRPLSARGGLDPIPLKPDAAPTQSTTGSAPPPTAGKVRPADISSAAQARKQGAPLPPKPDTPRQVGPSGELLERHRMRSDGQPLPPPPPEFRSDSIFGGKRPVAKRAEEEAESEDRKRDRRQSRERERDHVRTREEKPAPEELVIPEIGVKGLTGKAGRRGRDKGRAKKKSAKPATREGVDLKPSKVYGLADEFRRPIARKTKPQKAPGQRQGPKERRRVTGPVTIGSIITVGEFAEKLGLPAGEIIKKVFMMGQQLTINQLIDPDLCEILAQDFGVELIVDVESDESDIESYRPKVTETNLQPRPPVVTIMGHVDHGKTTLLDAYRQTQVAEGEFGGITQHIGAYRVQTEKGEIVFLDTPGHAAFTAMRARGASVTDIVVLIVGADDGVMPQTIEAINHAREADVPIMVAINKIDVPGADPQKVRNELMQHSIVPEELGGDHMMVEISAKQRKNLDELLEAILLQAEVLELKADPSTRAEGIIIESHLDPLRGAVATVLVKAGTLHNGDIFVVGGESGRVRAMYDDHGRPVSDARPAHPVEVVGLGGSVGAGELFLVLDEERIAREIASRRADRRRIKEIATTSTARHVSLESLHDMVQEGKLKELKVVLKADVQGSLEAVAQSVVRLSNEEVKVRILHKGTGGINESDVQLAAASDAVVVGFNVRPDPAAVNLADEEGIDLKTYRIIYELIDDFEKAIVGMLEKRYKEVVVGRAEIRQIFKVSRLGNIAGCMVLDGEVPRNASIRIVRDGVVVHDGKINTLRRMKDDVAKVSAGYECGITVERFQDIKEGDILEAYRMEEIPAELAGASS